MHSRLLKYNILFLISIFPIWILKFNIYKIDILYILVLIFLLVLINTFIVNLFKKNLENILFQLYLSFIIAVGIDNNLGFHNDIILINKSFWVSAFGNIYLGALAFFVAILLINFLLIKYIKSKGLIIISFFLISVSIFNLFDNSKSYKNIKSFDKSSVSTSFNKSKVLIILDEMSGLNSFESKGRDGKKFYQVAMDFAKNHNFILYSNIYSLYPQSINSISSLLNGDISSNFKSNKYIKGSKNFYSENDLVLNKTFENFNSISVYQSMHINYCNLVTGKINKCEQYNPFNQKNFVDGFKNSFLSRSVSAWNYNGSTLAAITWRFWMQFRFIDSTIPPYGEKATFENLLKKIKVDIKSKKFDLIFAHTLVPHKPYGYSKNCKYDGKLSLGNYSGKMSAEKHSYRHNLDRICTVKFLDNFLSDLKNINYLDKLEIIILSDHGSKNQMDDPESSLRNILFYKKPDLSYKEIDKKSILQKVFKDIMFE